MEIEILKGKEVGYEGKGRVHAEKLTAKQSGCFSSSSQPLPTNSDVLSLQSLLKIDVRALLSDSN